ncbi:carboxypeptidase-like regulatory domain-containing protein [Nonlabens tegetincola]|uniref:carboxypeptidase-like regulatory domain-containing protein n=1 Tax=Nonlabens tegetincola TaxID=323273 RepID=UPI0011B0A48F|nr:carboxypeptidase-like regulatory domain-containing protein [Nonlabens tegetincola]
MRQKFLIIFILFLTLGSCDCQYHLSGVVLDKLTKKPIENVAIGKMDTSDLNNSFNRKTMTGENGDYEIYGFAGRCNEITMFFSKDGYETQKIIFPNNSTDTILLQPTTKLETALFDYKKGFEILELEKSNDYPSSDKDTTACNNWTLNKFEIESIIQQSKPISGPEWHHLFGHYPCRIHGKLLQGSIKFEYSINSGAWFTVSSPDTTLMFGSFKEENNKYFLDSTWTEDEMEE